MRMRRIRQNCGPPILWVLLLAVLFLGGAASRATADGSRDGAIGGGEAPAILAGAISGESVSSGTELPAQSGLLDEIRGLLEKYYVDPLPSEKLQRDSVEDLIGGLGDPYTTYFNYEEYQDFIASVEGNLDGIGVRLDKDGDYIVVGSTIPGSPADRGGVQEGDRILVVDGNSLLGESLDEAALLIRGKAGTTVRLTVSEKDGAPRVLSLIREAVQIPSAEWELLPGDIGLISLSGFGVKASQEVQEAVAQLEPRSKGLILDLRGNPGGLLEEAIEVSEVFVPTGPVVQVTERGGETEAVGGVSTDRLSIPVVVLVDGWTASAAEVVTGAIQDYRTGLVVGERTYGKGSVQSVYELSNGGALKLTVARYRTALGREVDQKGILPDLVAVDREEQELLANRLLEEGLRQGRTAVVVPGLKVAKVEGSDLEISEAPILRGGRVYVTLDFFTQILDYFADWKKEEGVALVRYGPHELSLKLGDQDSSPAVVEGGRVWVPLRSVAEGLGDTVSWNQEEQSVSISF